MKHQNPYTNHADVLLQYFEEAAHARAFDGTPYAFSEAQTTEHRDNLQHRAQQRLRSRISEPPAGDQERHDAWMALIEQVIATGQVTDTVATVQALDPEGYARIENAVSHA